MKALDKFGTLVDVIPHVSLAPLRRMDGTYTMDGTWLMDGKPDMNAPNAEWRPCADVLYWDGAVWVPMYQHPADVVLTLDAGAGTVVAEFTEDTEGLSGNPNTGFAIDNVGPGVGVIAINAAVLSGPRQITFTVDLANYTVGDLLYMTYDNLAVGADMLQGITPMQSFRHRIRGMAA